MAGDPKYRNELLREDAERPREHPATKRAIIAPINAWLDRLVRTSPALEPNVAKGLVAIRAAQDPVTLRESRGLFQAQLARRVGVTRSAIAQLERGRTTSS